MLKEVDIKECDSNLINVFQSKHIYKWYVGSSLRIQQSHMTRCLYLVIASYTMTNTSGTQCSYQSIIITNGNSDW